MKKPIRSLLKVLAFGSIMLLTFSTFGQTVVDNPNLDQVPQWYLDQSQNMRQQISQIVTIDDYDNTYIGIDLAEGHISSNPLMPAEFFCAFNINKPHYTMDGLNWVNSSPSWGGSMRGDPVTAYDSLGNLYYENMYGSSIQGCKVVKSTDNGQTWGPSVIAINGNDKNWIACDQTAGPYANYVYTTMTNSGSGKFMRSTDHGETWENTYNASTQSLPGMMVCVGAYQNIQGGAVTIVTNRGNAFASVYTFYRSLDGGATFTLMSAQSFAGYVGSAVNGRNAVQNMRTRPYPFITADNSFGTYRGRLHLVYASNDPPGNGNKPDIWSRFSDDGGTTWSDALRVNTGTSPTESNQWHPATWCDKETGRLYVQWMDTRDTPTNDSALIYATYSDDGGQSFQVNQQVSNEKMKINCNTCGGGGTPRYEGDYNGIVSNSEVSMLTWSDFRWGKFSSFIGYFPDFAMRAYPTTKMIYMSDTIWAVIPGVKLYDNEAIFSATIEDPSSGSFTLEFPNGNSLNAFPDSIPIVVTVDQVPVGEYVMEITAEGPNGTPVHYREAIVDVISDPVAEFTANETTICAGSTIDFTDESVSPQSWLWTFEGGDPGTSVEQNPTGITYANTGTFNVSLEVTNPVGSDLIIKEDFITVNTIPESPTGASLSVCKNLLIPPLEVAGENILWYNNPALTEVIFEGNVFPTGNTLPGVYRYYVTQTIDNCESEAIEISLEIYDTPAVSFAPLDSVCLNTEVFKLENGQPLGGSYFGPGIFDDVLFDAPLAGIGTHILGYRYADENLCTDTAYQNITVNDIPQVNIGNDTSICGNRDITLNATTPNAASYLWTPGDFTTPSITVDSVGIGYNSQEFSVIVTDENTCSGIDAITVTFINCTGIEDIVGLENVSLYPNPNYGTFNFRITSSKSINIDLKVYNALGVIYLEQNKIVINGEYSSRIDLQDIKPGVYFITLQNDEGIFVKKFLVK
ncbi:MAG TPA: T9SS type A sorting domain-containing protein [Bacteroidales bacterium]|jgi:PKD repeat protein|nr:hypothetical protein [Bacteroidota bacterium]HJN05878.1 T9SS type A sorting domain-containing protein [Bacteroidales bacterium]